MQGLGTQQHRPIDARRGRGVRRPGVHDQRQPGDDRGQASATAFRTISKR
jgi:hypothetical protein